MPRVVWLVLALAAMALPLTSGCVRCHEFPPGTKFTQVQGPQGGFTVRPQAGGAETRPSK